MKHCEVSFCCIQILRQENAVFKVKFLPNHQNISFIPNSSLNNHLYLFALLKGRFINNNLPYKDLYTQVGQSCLHTLENIQSTAMAESPREKQNIFGSEPQIFFDRNIFLMLILV